MPAFFLLFSCRLAVLFSLCRAGAGRVLARPEPEMRPNEHVVVLLPFFGRPGHRHQFIFPALTLCYIFGVLVERTGVASRQGEKQKKFVLTSPLVSVQKMTTSLLFRWNCGQ
jgi:hypothetical protein